MKVNIDKMEDKKIEEKMDKLREYVKEKGEMVRKLKDNGEKEMDIKKEVDELKIRKKNIEDKEMLLDK
jgi:hypothetical protein